MDGVKDIKASRLADDTTMPSGNVVAMTTSILVAAVLHCTGTALQKATVCPRPAPAGRG